MIKRRDWPNRPFPSYLKPVVPVSKVQKPRVGLGGFGVLWQLPLGKNNDLTWFQNAGKPIYEELKIFFSEVACSWIFPTGERLGWSISWTLFSKGAFLWGDQNQDQRSKMSRIMVHQRNRGHGFIGSFDALWSEWSWITDPDSDHPKGRHLKILFVSAPETFHKKWLWIAWKWTCSRHTFSYAIFGLTRRLFSTQRQKKSSEVAFWRGLSVNESCQLQFVCNDAVCYFSLI